MKRAEYLEEAKKIICNDREGQYGSPENNFSLIADLWNSYLSMDILTPKDVGIMMALMKIARIKSGNFKEDSYIDAIGYLGCAGEIASEKDSFDKNWSLYMNPPEKETTNEQSWLFNAR